MKVTLKNSVKIGGEYKSAGDVIDVSDVDATRLIDANAAELVGTVEEPAEVPEAIEKTEEVAELIQVKGVNKPIAATLIAAGITDIAGLQKATAEGLVALKGIGKKAAKTILKDAAEFEV